MPFIRLVFSLLLVVTAGPAAAVIQCEIVGGRVQCSDPPERGGGSTSSQVPTDPSKTIRELQQQIDSLQDKLRSMERK